MRVTFEQADRAAEKIARSLRARPWLRGVGVEPDEAEGFAVSVRISHEAPEPDLPDRVDGVAVHFQRRKVARPR